MWQALQGPVVILTVGTAACLYSTFAFYDKILKYRGSGELCLFATSVMYKVERQPRLKPKGGQTVWYIQFITCEVYRRALYTFRTHVRHKTSILTVYQTSSLNI